MKVLVFGAGNILLSDEGIGVHFVKYMNSKYLEHPDVEFYDAGTMGILATHKIEEADSVIIVDSLDTEGAAGELRVYSKDDIALCRIPAKMSPHQIGLQEVMLLCDLRGQAPDDISFYGIIPKSLDSSCELSKEVEAALPLMEGMVLDKLQQNGILLSRNLKTA